MSKIVRISDENYARLQKLAVPLVDTIDDVLTQVLLPHGQVDDKKQDKQGRLARGLRTTEKQCRDYVLIALYLLGGEATLKTVQTKIQFLFGPTFKPDDLHLLSSGVVRWQNTVCWARDTLKQGGFLHNKEESGRGNWKLTRQGMVQAESLLGTYSEFLERTKAV